MHTEGLKPTDNYTSHSSKLLQILKRVGLQVADYGTRAW